MQEEKAKLLNELLEFSKSEKSVTKEKERTAAGYNEDLKDIRKNITQVLKEIEELAV